jgi:hypothetical protein
LGMCINRIFCPGIFYFENLTDFCYFTSKKSAILSLKPSRWRWSTATRRTLKISKKFPSIWW